MKAALLAAGIAATLVLAATAAAGGKTVRTTLAGTCTDHQKLDSNGALKSLTTTCLATGTCKCAETTKLTYSSKILEPGNGANGRETGTLVASSPVGKVTLTFAGKRTSLGVSTGTWTLGRVTGYKGIPLVRRGTYRVASKSLSQVVGSFTSIVRLNASFGCWACSGS